MYCNNFLRTETIKCSKIFRPWDFCEKSTCTQAEEAQDSTISTTTDLEGFDETSKCLNYSPEKTPQDMGEHKLEIATTRSGQRYPCNKNGASPEIGFRRPDKTAQISAVKHDAKKVFESLESPANLPVLQEYPAVDRYPLYPDVLHANLAQTLGLTPSDPLFLESISHGYGLEEYARVLSQEHHAKLLSSRKQRPKKYKCPHCDVGFSNNGQLKGHIRIHTGERPFKCDEKNCGKTFTRNEELTRHKRIHSGLRPFPCTHCGKRFGRKDHLKKHSRTHLQPRGLYAVPVMLPLDTWTTAASAGYPFVPMFGY